MVFLDSSFSLAVEYVVKWQSLGVSYTVPKAGHWTLALPLGEIGVDRFLLHLFHLLPPSIQFSLGCLDLHLSLYHAHAYSIPTLTMKTLPRGTQVPNQAHPELPDPQFHPPVLHNCTPPLALSSGAKMYSRFLAVASCNMNPPLSTMALAFLCICIP